MGSPGTDFRGVRDAVWGSTLPAMPRLVALRMIEHLPNVAPSTESLARHTGLSRATVIRCIKNLETWGCVKVARRNGCRSTYEFTGCWDRDAADHKQSPTATGVTVQSVSDSITTGVPQPSPPVAGSNPKQTKEADKEAANVEEAPKDPAAQVLAPLGEANVREQLGGGAVASTASAGLPEVRRIFEHYRARLGHPKAKLDRKRAGLIRARLRDFTPDELCRAIDGCAQSDWHMGRDPRTGGQRYDSPELILRDAQHIERFLDIESGKASGSTTRPRQALSESGNGRRYGSKQQDHGYTGLEGFKGVRA